ncbi:hypothetical protein ANCCAN_05601 [Ancylostoma caninum]|uniref:Uncharacterized protein n=1 Tax=Ancylostoma caninum TaxID=29170 RepID=A0A368GVB7_ANCCA|nr:hypothetical protein ANCCAN_05601 [Ancylostoma caninum]
MSLTLFSLSYLIENVLPYLRDCSRRLHLCFSGLPENHEEKSCSYSSGNTCCRSSSCSSPRRRRWCCCPTWRSPRFVPHSFLSFQKNRSGNSTCCKLLSFQHRHPELLLREEDNRFWLRISTSVESTRRHGLLVVHPIIADRVHSYISFL